MASALDQFMQHTGYASLLPQTLENESGTDADLADAGKFATLKRVKHHGARRKAGTGCQQRFKLSVLRQFVQAPQGGNYPLPGLASSRWLSTI